MVYTLTLNTKGQVVIPKEVRELLQLEKYLKLEVTEGERMVIQKPKHKFSDYFGSLKSNKQPPTKEQLRELRKQKYARKYGSN